MAHDIAITLLLCAARQKDTTDGLDPSTRGRPRSDGRPVPMFGAGWKKKTRGPTRGFFPPLARQWTVHLKVVRRTPPSYAEPYHMTRLNARGVPSARKEP